MPKGIKKSVKKKIQKINPKKLKKLNVKQKKEIEKDLGLHNMELLKRLKKSDKKTEKKREKKEKNKKTQRNPKNKGLLQKREKMKVLKQRRNGRNKSAKVGYNYAELGDKIYNINNGNDLGEIIEINRNSYRTSFNITVSKRNEGVTWDILMYFIFVLGIIVDCDENEKPYDNWPYGSENEGKGILYNVVVVAPSEREARELVAESNISGLEDTDHMGNTYNEDDSVWLNKELTFCNDIGDSIITGDSFIVTKSICY